MIRSIIVVGLLVVVFVWLARKGKIGNFSAGVGNALFQFHAFLRPTTYNIVEAKKQRKKENKQGDDGPPDLPPWAQAGD